MGLRWWRWARKYGVPDGLRQGRWECIVPRWWDAKRWIVWSRCTNVLETMLPQNPGGNLRFHTLRVRITTETPQKITLRSGKTLVPQAVDAAKLRGEYMDPDRRTVPDAYLESQEVLIKDNEGW